MIQVKSEWLRCRDCANFHEDKENKFGQCKVKKHLHKEASANACKKHFERRERCEEQ